MAEGDTTTAGDVKKEAGKKDDTAKDKDRGASTAAESKSAPAPAPTPPPPAHPTAPLSAPAWPHMQMPYSSPYIFPHPPTHGYSHGAAPASQQLPSHRTESLTFAGAGLVASLTLMAVQLVLSIVLCRSDPRALFCSTLLVLAFLFAVGNYGQNPKRSDANSFLTKVIRAAKAALAALESFNTHLPEPPQEPAKPQCGSAPPYFMATPCWPGAMPQPCPPAPTPAPAPAKPPEEKPKDDIPKAEKEKPKPAAAPTKKETETQTPVEQRNEGVQTGPTKEEEEKQKKEQEAKKKKDEEAKKKKEAEDKKKKEEEEEKIRRKIGLDELVRKYLEIVSVSRVRGLLFFRRLCSADVVKLTSFLPAPMLVHRRNVLAESSTATCPASGAEAGGEEN